VNWGAGRPCGKLTKRMGAQQQGMPDRIKPDCPIGGIHGGCLLGGSPVQASDAMAGDELVVPHAPAANLAELPCDPAVLRSDAFPESARGPLPPRLRSPRFARACAGSRWDGPSFSPRRGCGWSRPLRLRLPTATCRRYCRGCWRLRKRAARLPSAALVKPAVAITTNTGRTGAGATAALPVA
jgi:hypothetical protein